MSLRLTRLLFAWLLAFAVPAQAFAVASMAVCGPSHERMAERMHEAHGAMSSAGVHHRLGGTTAPSPGHAHADLAVPAEIGASDAASPDATAQFTCSACAACCVSAAMPAAIVVLVVVSSTEVFAPAEARGVAVFLGDGLERPPRPFLA